MNARMAIVVTTLAVTTAGTAQAAERLARAYADSMGAVHTVSTSGADRVQTRGARYRDAQASPDGRTYGALLIRSIDAGLPDHSLVEVCPKLVIWRDGKKLRTLGGDSFIREWGFWKDGEQVAIYAGALHFAGYYELDDLSTGKVLETSDDPVTETSPPWVRALER